MRGTEGLASAWRLCPHRMLMLYFGWTRLGQECMGTRLKGKARTGRILDIMAKKSYLLQGTIYSNRQTIVSYYNRTRMNNEDNDKQGIMCQDTMGQ